MQFVNIHSLDLSEDDAPWQELFEKTWPSYERWFTKEGLKARPGYLSSLMAFEATFPELIGLYARLCSMAGDSDLAARFLSMYCPPPYMSGCSQVAWTKDTPALIRNYDYSPRFFEGVVMKTNWLKPVIGMSDCTWGLLDGINADGLSASLTFGGRKITGKGFGIPLVIRYCLETGSTTEEALENLIKIPVHMAYNVTIMDKELNYATIYFVPGQANQIHYLPVGTNHQEEITWPDYAAMTKTVERRNILEYAVMNPHEHFDTMVHKFLMPPLYNTAYEKAFGTLYTAAYLPQTTTANYYWPGKRLLQTFDNFKQGKFSITLKATVHRKIVI
jgi:predicted choloylglycine hydrolase